MKKKIISTFLISLVILSLSAVTLFADSYIWIGQVRWADINTSTLNITFKRLLRNRDDVKYFIYRNYSGTTSAFSGAGIIFYSPLFSTTTARDNWKNQYGFSYINQITNGNLGSTNTPLQSSGWANGTVAYTSNQGNVTEYCCYYQVSFSWYFYSGIGNKYILFDYKPGQNVGTYVTQSIAYIEHGVFGTSAYDINQYVSSVELNRYFPYVFGDRNTSGDQRTYNSENTSVNTINIHPEDAFNTYEVNRNTSSTTVDFDTYVLPDAVDINNNVITSNELRYEDVTYNTEFSVSNVTNYYTGGGEGNDNNTGDNGGNGSVNNAGVNITVEENAINMTQTIEENAVNVTVNNNQNVSQDVANNINQIVNTTNPNGNTFQQTVQNLSEFIAIGNTFSQIAASYLSFMPPYVVTLLGITMALVMFMIVLRIIHLFI